jgi:hypothetical protein
MFIIIALPQPSEKGRPSFGPDLTDIFVGGHGFIPLNDFR